MSDWHPFHQNIITNCNRPYVDVMEMNQKILKLYFDTVNPGDTVYFLGDFAFRYSKNRNLLADILQRITKHVNCHMILGNHDKDLRIVYQQYFASISQIKEIKIQKQKIILCHYPMHSFNPSHQNAWQLYGHHHYDSNTEILGKRYNVSLEANNYSLVSFSQLKHIMQTRMNNWDFISNGF